MPRLRHFVAVILALSLSGAVAAFAQEAPLPDEQVKDRLGFIAGALGAGQPAARRWWFGWIGAYAAGAAAGGVLAASHWDDTKTEGAETVADRDFAEGMLVSGATFALGAAALALDPFTPASAARKLARLPETSADERLAKLRQAEELLRKCAARERRGRSLATHLLNAGANAAAAVVIKAGFRQSWGSALVTFATGEAVSLLNIFSQPMRATRDLKKYEAGLAAGGSAAPGPEARWSLGLWPGGLSFRLEF